MLTSISDKFVIDVTATIFKLFLEHFVVFRVKQKSTLDFEHFLLGHVEFKHADDRIVSGWLLLDMKSNLIQITKKSTF